MMQFERSELFWLIAVPFTLGTLQLWRARTYNLRTLFVSLLRLSVCGALIIALASPYTETKKGVDKLFALLDVSASVTDLQGDELLNSAQKIAQALNLPLTVATFAKGSSPIGAIYNGESFSALRRGWEKLGIGATNIEAALTNYTSASSSSVLLLSDGYETEGSTSALLTRGLSSPVYPMTPPAGPSEDTVQISQLYVPLTVKAHKSVDIRATLSNGSDERKSGNIEIKHGNQVVLSKSITLEPHRDTVVSAPSNPSLEGLNEITTTFSWKEGGSPRSVSRTSWLSGEKRDKVLVLSGSPDDDRFLSQLLKGEAYQLQSEIGGQELRNGAKPSDYRVIVLNNISRSALPPSFIDAIPNFVRAGGGLIMVGGNQSFGVGGYIGSALEDILPVKLLPPRTEKKRLNVAVQLVLDKSRSMAQDNRLEFAKDGATQLIRSLKDDDYIGVIGFDDIPYIALPIAPVQSVRDVAVEKIGRLFPTRKTNLFPAMDEGRRALTRINAGRKHMVILTDGKLPDAGTYYLELVRQMRTLGITVSTVLVGDDYDDGFLKQIAEAGGGAFYQTSDPSNLPRIFLSDVRVTSGEQSLKENPDLPVRPGPSGILSTHVDTFPTLRGFVENAPRDDANTELVVRAEGNVYPLLASWKVGKGHTIAFTSDVNGRWSSNWIRWESINEFWSDLVEASSAKLGAKRSNIDFDLRSWVDGGDLVIDLAIFDDLSGRRLTSQLTSPDGSRIPLTLASVSTGHYQARVNHPIPGRYLAAVSVDDEALPEVAWTLSGEIFGEKSHSKPNYALLEQIAVRSGGKVNPSAEDLRGTLKFDTVRSDLSLPFFAAALLLFFLELSVRELFRPRRKLKT